VPALFSREVDTLADYSITGDTRLDTSGFTKGISSMTVAAGNLISDLAKTAGSKLAGLAQSSVGVGMSFDASMSQVAATMGTTVDQIQSLTDTAKEMGSTTKFTATQAADALNYLALAGYDADKAAEVLPSVLNLAAAGGMDLAYASNLATKAMASLQIEATKENLDEFGNKLAVGASKAGATVSELGEAILTVGGTAANLKGGTTELITALGKLADVGLVGAEGGTHLRNVILSLQSPTKDAREVMEQLGLEVYDAQGNMRQLDDILTDLNTVMDGMTQGDKDSIINALFNKTDLAAVNGLLAAQGEQWETLATQIDNADGAMGQMAETQQDNLQGVMTSMGSAFEGLQLAVFERLEPTLTELGNYGIQCIRTLSSALSEGGPEAMLQAAGEILAELAAGVAEQLPGLMSTGVQILAQLAEGIVAATPQILSVAAKVLAALVQGLSTALPQLVSTGIQMISMLGEGLKSAIPAFLAQALPLAADFAAGLRENIGQIVDAGIAFILNLAQGLADGLPTLIEQLPGIVSDIAGIINDNAPKLLVAGVQLIAALLKGLVQSIPTLIANIPQICKAIFDVFTAFRWLDIGKFIVDGLWNGITTGWTALIGKVKDLVNLLPRTVKTILGIHSPSKVFDEIGMNICKGLAQGLTTNEKLAKDAAAQVVASVTNTATTLADGIETVTQSVTETLKDGTTQQKQTITATGTEIIDGVERTVKTVTTIAADGTKTVSKTIEDAGPQFSSAAELLTHQFTEKLDSSWEQINKSIQSDVVGSIKTLLQAIKDGDLESIATWSAAYFWNACTQEQRTQIQTFAMDALSKLSGSLSGVFKNLASLAAGFVGQFVPAAAAATGAQEGLNIAMDANPILLVISLIGMLVGALGSFITINKNASSSVKSIWGGIGDFMSYIFEGLLRVYGAYLQGFVNIINGLIAVYNSVAWLWDGKIDPVSNIAFDYADKIRKDREERKAAEKAEAENAKAQAQLDAQYAAQSGTAEKKQLDAKYNKKLAELEKAKLTKDDPGMLEAEKKVLAAGYEQDLADLEKKVLDAQYKLASAQLEQKTATDATRLAELEKQINEAQNVIQMSDLEKQLLGVEYQKSLAELIAKYQPKKDNTSSSGNGSTGGTSGSGTPVPAPDTGHDEVIAANTAALQEANKKLSEMVRQANALVLSDNMKVSSRVAASGTAQVAAAANNYHREGDTTVNQYIYSKAQSAADLARETRWEADRAKARKT
jgi:TP901 family phage tail tape measure protein